MSRTDDEAGGTLKGESVHWDFSQSMSYGQYLGLDRLLALQSRLSGEHDEMLFIVIHQASELWMKLCLFELEATVACVREDRLGPAFKMLARVAAVQKQLTQSWDILSTMTPADYMRFRASLGQSSGFQSAQFRMIEFLLGNKNRAMLKPHRSNPAALGDLERLLNRPSLYDESLRLLARRGFAVPADRLERDWSEPYEPSPEVEAAWLAVYRDVEAHWDLYELAEKLVDLEHRFQQWRFHHMTTVERIIGQKRGTGGSSGVGYLARTLEKHLFPELWTLRTSL